MSSKFVQLEKNIDEGWKIKQKNADFTNSKYKVRQPFILEKKTQMYVKRKQMKCYNNSYILK